MSQGHRGRDGYIESYKGELKGQAAGRGVRLYAVGGKVLYEHCSALTKGLLRSTSRTEFFLEVTLTCQFRGMDCGIGTNDTLYS